jgi:hypothetical protein
MKPPNTTRIQEGYDWRIGTVKKEKLIGWISRKNLDSPVEVELSFLTSLL